MKKIMWISTGGTIACIKGENGLSPASSESQMNEMLEIIGDIPAEIECVTLMNIDSTNISCDDIRKIGEAAHKAITEGFDGIVITHGTDTMAYTSAILRKMLKYAPVPIIMTGSQRPFFEIGSDAPANLRNSFKAALDERFKGVHILFGDKVIRGDAAHKEYSFSDNAFISSEEYKAIIKDDFFGNICPEIEGNYCFDPYFDENVMLITVTPATPSDLFEFALRSGCKGIIIEGYGCGGIPERLLPAIKKASGKGVKIMLISQCFYEGVSMDIYEVGVLAASCGIISGGKLTAEAALAELMFMIGKEK